MAVRKHTRAVEDRTEPLVSVLKAIAHPLRLRIVALLCDGERHVGALAKELGASPVIVSQQLRILRDMRIVAATRTRRHVVYRVERAVLRDLVRFAEGCATSIHGAAPSRRRDAPSRRRRGVPRLPPDATGDAPFPRSAHAAAVA